jgi:DNA-binding transcriptional ArsR family regulator
MADPTDHDYISTEHVRDGHVVRINPDAKSLQALAHPMRGLILDILRSDGPATGAALGRRLDLRAGSVSWHLQKLAEHGYVEIVPDRGRGRERWWRAAIHGVKMQYAEAMEAGVGEAAAATAFLKSDLSTTLLRALRFLDEDWDFDWRHATIFNSYELHLDPPALEQLREEFWALIGRYMQNPSTSPAARKVTVSAQGHPIQSGAMSGE